MYDRASSIVLLSTAYILLVAGMAKLLAFRSPAHFLETSDPVLGVKVRTLLLALAICELSLAAFLILSKQTSLKLLLTAYCGANFLAYHGALIWMKAPQPCSCLGNFTEWVPLSPRTMSLVLLGCCLFMFTGATLLLILRRIATSSTGG
jgi:hypothetical protein